MRSPAWTGCGDMLASLARENSFVIPLDAAQERYRYHQLFAEILRYDCMAAKAPGHARPACSARWPGTRLAVIFGNALYWAVRAGNRHHVVKLMARAGSRTRS